METPNNPTLRTLAVHFDLEMYARQIPQWRGAFVEFAGVENDLFHNHKNDLAWINDHLPLTEAEEASALEDGEWSIDKDKSALENGQFSLVQESYHYRYPLIQYRSYKRMASIFALNDGIEAIQQVLSTNAWRINWEGEPRPLQITGMQMQEYTLRMLARPKTYQLFKWLALNAENYEKWQQCTGLVDRIALLGRILASHIIAFAGSVGWRVPERLEVRLQDLQRVDMLYCHGIPLLAFNVTYTVNALLPPHIALGKGVSHGYGWQVPYRVAMPNGGAKAGLVRRREEF